MGLLSKGTRALRDRHRRMLGGQAEAAGRVDLAQRGVEGGRVDDSAVIRVAIYALIDFAYQKLVHERNCPTNVTSIMIHAYNKCSNKIWRVCSSHKGIYLHYV